MNKNQEQISFFGRVEEQKILLELFNNKASAIVVVYGRRRIGKTRLIEHTFQKYNLYKFEGLENESVENQKNEFIRQLKIYFKLEFLVANSKMSWTELFQILTPCIMKKKVILYLEELQWLATYDTSIISAIKYFWDNFWQKNPNLLIVLCGSSPSFMINKVLKSKALYNRSEIDLPVRQFGLSEVKQFMGSKYSNREIMDAILTVGAIPPYLQKLKSHSSIYLSLLNNCKNESSYFITEYERIFTSSLATNADYRVILNLLAKYPYLDRSQVSAKLKKIPGGTLSTILSDLEMSEFIISYTPANKKINSKLKRYALSDPYLRIYHKCLFPKLKNILAGNYSKDIEQIITPAEFRVFLGLSFERWVLKNTNIFARMLEFSGIAYNCSSYFIRADKNTQIDLVYERADRVSTIVEIKYTDRPITKSIIDEFEKKLSSYPVKKSLQKVLISASGVDSNLEKMHYFDRIITLDDIFKFIENS